MMSFLSSSITAELRDAYLDRLDLEAELPSAEGLRRLHRRHDAVTRIAHHGRGGYCYHMNGAFGLLLRSPIAESA